LQVEGCLTLRQSFSLLITTPTVQQPINSTLRVFQRA